MCSLGESLYTHSNPSKTIFAHAEALLEDMNIFEYLLKSKKYTDNLKAIVVEEACLVRLLNGEWDIFDCFSIFFPSLKMLWLYTCMDNIYSVLRPV
jgi:hypothetical protein